MSITMPRVSLYQSRGKVEQIPCPQPLNVNLLVSRCLSIGLGSSVKRPVATVAKTRSNWRASLQHSTLPAIKSLPNSQLAEVRRGGEHGNSETRPVFAQPLPPSNVQRITVDLRSALARVHEPCEHNDETLDEHTVLEEVGRGVSPNAGDTSAFDRSQQPADTGNWKPDPHPKSGKSRSNERSFERLKIKMPLPPIANRPSEREPAPRAPLTSSAHNPKVGLLQVTKDGALANPDHDFQSARRQGNQLVPFPKIFLTTSPSNVSVRAECASRRERTLTNLHVKGIDQSFEQSVEDSTIPFHQLLHQMRKRTSSANHVLITEVLKCLREELWLTSPKPKCGQNEDAIGPLYNRRSIPFYRRAENRLDGQARCIYQSSPLRRNKSPVKLSLSKNRSL
ncbi:uncharacterized protein LOC132406206 isoform X2 [Hypanus sabinus]|uniref:uncharacterized protein LOC132406206 isoform X2 n=1 Tax=Hypanus sabinus TaxID=79690 RepID=UPI0028C45152|nr:uncharacterized protein LOC132406206 isoform X2 [Hypanus sabinus]